MEDKEDGGGIPPSTRLSRFYDSESPKHFHGTVKKKYDSLTGKSHSHNVDLVLSVRRAGCLKLKTSRTSQDSLNVPTSALIVKVKELNLIY